MERNSPLFSEKPWKAIFYFLIISGLLSSWGCKKMETGLSTDQVEFGVLLPLTGSGSSAGESSQLGISMAFEEVNDFFEAGGTDIQATFSVRNTDTNPATALEQLKAFYQEGIRYVIGPYSSTNAAALLDYANQQDMVLLSPSSVASSLAINGDNLYRMVPTDTQQAEAVTALFSNDYLDAVIPVVRDDVWGDGLIEDVSKLTDQEGVTLLDPVWYDPSAINAGNIAAEITQAIDNALQQYAASKIGVYLVTFGEGASILEASAGEPECSMVRWYGSSAFANNADLINNKTASEFAIQQSLRCPSFAPDPAAKNLWEPVNSQLTQALGREPEVYALTAYDAVWLMAQAIPKCTDHYDVDQFKAALEGVANNHNGITGKLTFDANGDREQASFNFWGLNSDEDTYHWKSYGHFSTSGGLELF